MIIVNSPIIIIDIINGFSDKECLKIPSDNFEISVSVYLLVSGFTSAFNLLCCLVVVFYLHNLHYENKNIILNNFTLKILSLLFSIGQLSWNIIGGYIFLDLLSNHSLCGNFIINYLFITIIIKIISCLVAIFHKYRMLTFYNENENNN